MKKLLINSVASLNRYSNLMKTLLVVSFMMTTVVSKAQEKFIGENYGDISTEMIALHNTNINTGETSVAGQYQATFKVGEGFAYSFLFSKADNVCTGVKEIMGRDLLDASVNKLNGEYKKVDDTHWVSKDNKYRVNLDILPDMIVVTHLQNKKQ